jgi:hypothetical protein
VPSQLLPPEHCFPSRERPYDLYRLLRNYFHYPIIFSFFARSATGCLSSVQTHVSTTPMTCEPDLTTILDPSGLLRDQSLATTTKTHRQHIFFSNPHTRHNTSSSNGKWHRCETPNQKPHPLHGKPPIEVLVLVPDASRDGRAGRAPLSGSVDQWWKVPRRSRGQTQATRGVSDPPQDKGNWRVSCFCLCVKHPWFPTGVLHCPGHPSCAGA